MPAQPVCDLMRALPPSVRPDEGAALVFRRMRREAISIVPVIDHGELIGLVIDRDLVSLGSTVLARCQILDVMRGDPVSAPPWMPVSTALARMVSLRAEALVIIDHGHLVGLFTLDDAARRCGDLLDAASLRH